MIEIETKRLRLRNWTLADSQDVFEYTKSELVGPRAGWPPHETEEESQKCISRFIKKDDVLAIELKAEKKVIGSIGLHERQPDESIHLKQREIGDVLNPNYWGNGYMPEAVKGLLELGFDELGLDLIWCAHNSENRNSKRVIEKSGFNYQFKKNKTRPLLNGIEVVVLYYSLSRDEYRGR